MTREISRSSKLIDLCLCALALEERAHLDGVSRTLLARSLEESETAAARLRTGRGFVQAEEALGHLVVSACIRQLLDQGGDMDVAARRRIIDAARIHLQQLDELVGLGPSH